MTAVVEAEQTVVVGMERISVIVALVVDNFLEVSDSLVPLTVEQIYFSA